MFIVIKQSILLQIGKNNNFVEPQALDFDRYQKKRIPISLANVVVRLSVKLRTCFRIFNHHSYLAVCNVLMGREVDLDF